MKKHRVLQTGVLFTFILTTVSSSSFAKNKNTVLAEWTIQPGLTPQPVQEFAVKLYSDGKIVQQQGGKSTQLGTLGTSILKKIEASLLTVSSSSKLEDLNPQAPVCEDSSTEVLSIYPKHGKAMAVWKSEKCHEYELKPGAEASKIQEAKKVIELFRFLATL